MRILILLAIFSTLVISCKNETKEATQGTKEQVAEEKVAIKLHTFDGGSIMANNLNLFAQGDTYKGQRKALADAFYVIEHPKGTLIWDTGLPEGLVGQGDVTPEGGAFTISRKDSIKNQLNAKGLAIEDIDHIAFSHIHFDHTGAANHFENAQWIVQESEYTFAKGDSIKGNSFYAPDSFSKLNNVKQISGDLDLFEDGTVIIKSMPGHTPGHQVLYLELPQAGPVILAGDMYHFIENREKRIVPQFNYDIPETEESIKQFEAFVDETKANVIIQHEKKHLPVAKKLQ
ncbi:N-acyl homoserine lactonase family protein [Gangjinia marincola]|uniref:N-acyl homoserine lactonase family protein n=1 Tax=Gangjinia marincola TaxID=578463 RepID=A0ABN1MEM6_9FLAO